MPERLSYVPPEALERKDKERAELAFFDHLAFATNKLEHLHPLGPETDDEDTIKERRKKAGGLMEALRCAPFAKPLLKMMAVLAGVGGIAFGHMRERGGEQTVQDETAQLETGEEYELKRLIYDELLERGEVALETEARYGKSSWTPEEAVAYEQIPTLSGKFEYLHKGNVDLIKAYRSAQGRVENFSALYETMGSEFARSSLAFEFASQAARDAQEIIAQMKETEALALYKAFSMDLAKKTGIAHARELAQALEKKLPASHAVMKKIHEDGWLAPEVGEWLKKRADNAVLFDQVMGRIEVYHAQDGKVALLDAFPGNGGSPESVAWEQGMPGHIAVRTPDGKFTFDRSLEKKSPSWQNSWVADSAALRWADEAHTQVDYQDQDGTWRRLTGSDAEFTVYGAAQKPFREKNKSHLYRQATRMQEDGTRTPPMEFQVGDVLDGRGELRAAWENNDFGPKSIRMKDSKGELMSVFFHSSPLDESRESFLDFSHGCIHMKPQDIDRMDGYLDRGSKIRVSSADASEIVVMR